MEQTLFNQPRAAAPIAKAGADAFSTRQSAEIQAAMVIARRFGRDELEATERILRACRRPGLAEVALYSYPRGGSQVEGPSIRMAEALAQCWGHIDFGVVELEQQDGESSVMAYAWDLLTNTRQTKIFTVKHERKAHGKLVGLDDPRDIYEIVANQGARRLRACILGVIPGDIIETAVNEVNHTLKSGSKKSLSERLVDMINAFMEFGVSKAMIEARLSHNLNVTSEAELIALRKIYTSLRDGMSKREDWFQAQPKAPVFDAPTIPAPADDDIPYDSIGTNTDAAPAAPPAKTETVLKKASNQDLLADWWFKEVGATFDQFQVITRGLGEEDASSWTGFEDLHGQTAGKYLRAKAGLLAELQKLRTAEGSAR